MTLVWAVGMVEQSLTVPPECARGLSCFGGVWRLHVSDPTTMAVSVFKLTTRTLDAAREVQQPTDHRSGESLLAWLLAQPYVDAIKETDAGQPSARPGRKVAGPRPSLSLPLEHDLLARKPAFRGPKPDAPRLKISGPTNNPQFTRGGIS